MYHHEQSPGSQPPSASQPALALSRSTWLQTDPDPESFTLILILTVSVKSRCFDNVFNPSPTLSCDSILHHLFLTPFTFLSQAIAGFRSSPIFTFSISSPKSVTCWTSQSSQIVQLSTCHILLLRLERAQSSHAGKGFSITLAAPYVCSLSANSSGFQLIASAHPSKVSHLRTHSGEKSQMPTAGELSAILSRSVSLWNNGGVYSREFGVNAVHNERNAVTNSYNNPREANTITIL